MRRPALPLACLILAITLQSCEFSCSVGGKKDEVKGTAVVKDGARVYNDIQLSTNKVKLTRAYLVFKDGTAMPEGNLVDFTKPVNVQLEVEDGWVNENGKVMLGAAEKITAGDGTVILDEQDLFKGQYDDGIAASDASKIGLTANITLKKDAPPASFTVSFRVWDKKGEGYVEGSYKLYSK
jgi:hypothetical protein